MERLWKGRGRGIATAAALAAWLLIAVLSLLLLPTYIALTIIAAATVVFLVADALSIRTIPRMALRNSVRRPAMTALIVGGLMIGTAAISSSFVINDTLDNMIVVQAGRAFGEVDFTVAAPGNGLAYYEESYLDPLVEEIRAVEGVSAAHPVIVDSVAGQDARTGLGEPMLQVIGAGEEALRELGGLSTTEGEERGAPSAGVAYLNDKAASGLDAAVGDELVLLRGNTSMQFTVGAVLEPEGLAGYGDGSTVIISLPDLQALVDRPDQRNLVMVSTDRGREGIREDIETVLSSSAPGSGLIIASDRQATIDESRDFLQMFVMLFFVFGSFSVIAGTALIVSLFTMLGEERKGELAILRAIGLQRDLLRRLLMYEGLVYAVLASAVGTVAGVALAYVVAWVMSMVSSLTGTQLLPYFDFRPSSLLISFGLGAIITLVTSYVTISRISRLNIVRAMRGVPGPRTSRSDRRTLAVGAALLVSGLAMTTWGVSEGSLIPANTGFSLLGLSLGFLGRRFVGDRWAWTLSGAVTILPWLPLPGDNRLFPYPAPTEIFVLAGLFMVTSCLLVVMFNGDLLAGAVVKLLGGRGEYRAVVRTAMSYPLRARFRTALSIFIFGLVIFTVTTLSVVSGLIGTNVERQITESSGGFDIIAQAGTPLETDPWTALNASEAIMRGENITSLLSFPAVPADLKRGDLPMTMATGANITLAIGIDSRFFEQGRYPLEEWDRDRFPAEEDAWNAVLSDSSLAIVDGGLAGGFDQNGMAPIGEPMEVGDPLTLSTAAGTVNVTIAGIMNQSVLSGVFLTGPMVRDELGAEGVSVMLVKLAGGLDAGEQSTLLERTFLAYGVQTVAVADLAREAARTIDGMFSLGRGYLALGLVIGIIGLGIITMRNVRERRIEIGIMRAIGFRQRMVVSNFILESGAVSMLGILIGTAMGLLVGYQLWLVTLKDSGFSFTLDWGPIILIDILALVATLLSVYPAARGSTRIAPAGVLRFE